MGSWTVPVLRGNLNIFPSREHGMAIPVDPTGEGRIILSGASHMRSTAEYLPDCISFAIPNFQAWHSQIVEYWNQLEKL